MSKKAALGKGFEGLIPVGMDIVSVAAPGETIKQISIDKIDANLEQPRKHFDEKALQELAASIKQHGVIQPIIVTPSPGDRYRIIAGERRWRASKIAGLKRLPAVIRNHKELEELEIALVENVQRVDLNPLEQAASIIRLRDQFSLSPKQIAAKLGKAETTISNIVRLLQLPDDAVKALQENRISEGHARAILALKADEAKQKELLNNIIVHKWSVRQAENFVTNKKVSTKTTKKLPQEVDLIFESLPQTVRKRVRIVASGKTGKVTVSYKDIDELSKILKTLQN